MLIWLVTINLFLHLAFPQFSYLIDAYFSWAFGL